MALTLFNIHKKLFYCPDVGNLLIIILALGPDSCKNYSRRQKLNNLLSFCWIKDCLCSPVDELSLCLVVIKRNSSCSLAWPEMKRPSREHREFFLSQIICRMYAVGPVWKWMWKEPRIKHKTCIVTTSRYMIDYYRFTELNICFYPY